GDRRREQSEGDAVHGLGSVASMQRCAAHQSRPVIDIQRSFSTVTYPDRSFPNVSVDSPYCRFWNSIGTSAMPIPARAVLNRSSCTIAGPAENVSPTRIFSSVSRFQARNPELQ